MSKVLQVQSFRNQMSISAGGGLLIAVHSLLVSYLLDLHSSVHGNETMGIHILLFTAPINIITYSSGQVSHDLLHVSSSIQDPFFICGNFNSHHPLWRANTNSKQSEDFAQ